MRRAVAVVVAVIAYAALGHAVEVAVRSRWSRRAVEVAVAALAGTLAAHFLYRA